MEKFGSDLSIEWQPQIFHFVQDDSALGQPPVANFHAEICADLCHESAHLACPAILPIDNSASYVPLMAI